MFDVEKATAALEMVSVRGLECGKFTARVSS